MDIDKELMVDHIIEVEEELKVLHGYCDDLQKDINEMKNKIKELESEKTRLNWVNMGLIEIIKSKLVG